MVLLQQAQASRAGRGGCGSVAEFGRDKDLDVLVNDTEYQVRVAVARRGRDKDLDILVNDEDPAVRKTVARHVRCKLT